MLSVVWRVMIGTILLLVVPVVMLILNWHWQPKGNEELRFISYWITETGSYPWAGITCVVFALWFVWLLKLPFRKAVILIAILATAVIGSQIIKSVIKETFQHPRPYVVWMEETKMIKESSFYTLTRPQRSQLISHALSNNTEIPSWLNAHWQDETGYAFPSGHTLFAATWALIGIILLWSKRKYVAITLVSCWAVAMEVSRLILGMHWPIDLIFSVMISVVVAVLTGWVCLRYKLLPDREKAQL